MSRAAHTGAGGAGGMQSAALRRPATTPATTPATALAALPALALLAAALALTAGCRAEAPRAQASQVIRCAVIGGMMETGFWPELTERFTRLTGHRVETVAVGPKQVVVEAFRKGGIDLITVHASDAMINLVADGLAVDPQPWARNDFVLVGPAADPAKVRGLPDAVAAMRAIIEAKSPFLIQASLGADSVLHELLEVEKLSLPEASMVPFGGADQRAMLARAVERGAYTLVGRIPFTNGKIAHHGLEIMVQGDPRLRRPYLVETARGPAGDARLQAARELAAFLRAPATQEWISVFGAGRFDTRPLFFPVTVAAAPAP